MSKLYKFILDSLSKNMSESKLTKNQLLVKIDQLTVSLEEQKQENNVMKDTHLNEVGLYKELNTNLMSMIKKHEKEIERIENTNKKHEYEYTERLKEKDKIHKREKEKKEKTYKREVELMQQTINHLEQTINDLQTQNNEDVSTPELY